MLKIREEFGEEIYEENKEQIYELLKSMQEYPKSSTYCVKYLGVTDGKIGILSRRLPFSRIDKSR
jgi:hypothetical protein